MTEQDFDLIGGGTPEEIAAKAAKLAARIPAQEAGDAKNINPVIRANPSGGSDPSHTESKDWLRDVITDK